MSKEMQLIEDLAEEILQEYTNCYSEVDKEVLAKMIYNACCRKQSEWISVDERLPEKNQIVLCCLGLVMNVYTYMGDGVWEDSYGYFQKDEPISHWMPLPEPPMMKGE